MLAKDMVIVQSKIQLVAHNLGNDCSFLLDSGFMLGVLLFESKKASTLYFLIDFFHLKAAFSKYK